MISEIAEIAIITEFGQDLALSGAQVHGLDGAFAFGQAPQH